MTVQTRDPRFGAPPPPRARPRLSLDDPRVRGALWQLLATALVVLAAWFFIQNTADNLADRRIASGFGFLENQAGFEIGEGLVTYSPADTYGRAFVVGILNTLKIAAIGILLATLLGTLIGIARLSTNWLLSRLSAAFVEWVRNIPLLLQLFLWYAILTEGLPGPRQAIDHIPGVFLSNRGLKLPAPGEGGGWEAAIIAFLLGAAILALWSFWSRRGPDPTVAVRPPSRLAALLLLLGLPALCLLALGAPVDVPVLQGFNFQGGISLSPEFAALLIGLVIYTAAFIAEIVRSGILAVPHGQTEAALSLGLSRGAVLRLIVLPQALRVIIPPTTSQYLNLTKNSSLAVAIGYPDFVSIVNTTINQTGQAVEGVAAIMAAYLTISLSLSALLNWYDQRIALKGR